MNDSSSSSVPNAPCGVERLIERLKEQNYQIVPNAPCGVERRIVRKCLILVFYKLYDALGGAHII